MDIKPNENLIFQIPSVQFEDRDELTISRIERQVYSFQLEESKKIKKPLFLELKLDYILRITKRKRLTVRIKRVKIANLFRDDITKNEANLNKEIQLLQKASGIRNSWLIPVRFMVKWYKDDPEMYEKVFFHEMLLKISYDTDFKIDLYNTDNLKFNTINNAYKQYRIIEVDTLRNTVKPIMDNVAKDIGYRVMVNKTVAFTAKALANLFKKPNKKKSE